MLLEMEKEMTETSRLNFIVFRSPISIQDKLDRENIKNTDSLMNELGIYEYKQNKNQKEQKLYQKTFETKTCNICEPFNYPNGFHPIERCRIRNTYTPKI